MKTKSRIFAKWLTPALLLCGFALQAQTVPFQLEAGYRWLSLKGNEQMYRTQINERDGFLIRSFTLSTSAANGDRYRIDASDLGVGPASALRIETERGGMYRLTLGYRRTEHYSFLSGFDTPGTNVPVTGLLASQHTIDRTRDMVDVDLELLPDHTFTPFVGYSFNRFSGPGTSTYHFGNDEFLLSQNLSDKDNELRVGTGFKLPWLYGSITQGWRKQTVNDDASLASGAGAGNNPGNVFGTPVTATGIARTDHSSVKTPFTALYVTGQLNKLRLVGNYNRFAAKSTGDETESTAGAFSSFGINRFFTGFSEMASQTAKNTTWRGGARAELTVAPSLDAFAGYQTEHRELDGTAVLGSVYLQSVTFGGVGPEDLRAALNMTSSLERDEKYWNAGVSARNLGPFALRAEFRQTKQDVTARPDAEEIVVPGPSQGGKFDRTINTLDLSANFAKAGFLAGIAYRTDSADRPIFRIDYADRDRVRARAGWLSPKNFFRVGVTAEQTKLTNDETGINLDAKYRQYTADAEINPIAALHFRAAYSQFKTDTSILYRRPEILTTATSIHAENGKSAEAGIGLNVKKVTLDTSYMRYENRGTTPFDINRYRARVTFDFLAKAGIAAEFDKDKYDDATLLQANFDATRYGIFVRYHP